MMYQYKVTYMLSINGQEGTRETHFDYAEAETKEDAIAATIDFMEQCLIDDGIEFDCDEDSITTTQTFADGSKQVQAYYDFEAEKVIHPINYSFRNDYCNCTDEEIEQEWNNHPGELVLDLVKEILYRVGLLEDWLKLDDNDQDGQEDILKQACVALGINYYVSRRNKK